MATKDPRIGAYIKNAQPFARPILTRLRKVVHAGAPGVVEGWKWSFPHFDYKGIFCSMAAFKEHCTFGFWKYQILVDRGIIKADDKAMGQFGRITSVDDLPSDRALIAIVKAAAKLNDDGVKQPRPKTKPKPPVKTPPFFLAALKKNKKALAEYEGFSPSCRREYVEWVTEAKTDETRQRRVETAVGWIAEGKSRNWKYER